MDQKSWKKLLHENKLNEAIPGIKASDAKNLLGVIKDIKDECSNFERGYKDGRDDIVTDAVWEIHDLAAELNKLIKKIGF